MREKKIRTFLLSFVFRYARKSALSTIQREREFERERRLLSKRRRFCCLGDVRIVCVVLKGLLSLNLSREKLQSSREEEERLCEQNNMREENDCCRVIFDLDGTLINTEAIVDEAVVSTIKTMKKSVSEREIFDAAEDCRGQRPLEASVELCEKLSLHDVVKPAELLTKCGEKLQWDGIDIPDMPGAVRLLEFLKRKKVPMALATSTSRKELEKKMKSTGRTSDDGKHRGDLLSYFDAICCGDEVAKGKPDPEIFHLAMERLGVKREDAGRCLVFEDTPHGVSAAKAAGCCCVAVPSLRREKFDMYKGADRVYHSLMDIELEDFGLPKFEDWKEVKTVEFVKEDGDASLSSQTRKYERFLKLDAFLELTGPVIRGFGRGSKMLGIPTANLDVVPLKQQIDKLAPGIYFGFAKISSGKHKSTGIHRTVMSIGYNPFFNDKRKSIEPWLLREFEEDFYDETLSVLVCAYVRAECNFTTVENLIERIRKDARVCEEALDLDLVEGLDSWKHWFDDDV